MDERIERQVQIGHGGTISHSLYLAFVKFPYTQEDPTTDYDMGGSEENNPSENIGNVVDQWLIEKSRKAARIEETRSKAHGWRRDENEAGREKVRRKVHPISVALPTGIGSIVTYRQLPTGRPIPQLDVELTELYGNEVPRTAEHCGTNHILEHILHISEESGRTNFLRRLRPDGDYVEGAYVVREAYKIGRVHGLERDYSEIQQKKILLALIDCINRADSPPLDLQESIRLTGSVVEGFGLENMPKLMKEFYPFRNIGSLVPKGHVYPIAIAMQTPGLRGRNIQDLMNELGYHAVIVNGKPVLYNRPSMKPI